MAKILVADDEVDLEMLIKQKFRRQIREQKYEFLFALNGADALAILQDNPDVSVVLSDINMPEIDGLTLLTRLNEVSPLVKAVMVSAYGDMENIRTAMNRGAFDFVCKPVNFEDLELTIEKTILHVQQLKDTLQAIKENNILRMYVDETVLKFMNRREFENTLLSNETVEASVAFIDICSFTSITEKEPADKVVKLLNRYFDVIVKEIIAQGGYVDKFIGDAVMAVFRGDYHLDKCLEACLAVRAQVEALAVEHLIHHHLSFFVFQADGSYFFAVEGFFYFFVGGFVEQDLSGLGCSLQTLGRVHHVTDHRIIEPPKTGRTDISRDHFTAVDADGHLGFKK